MKNLISKIVLIALVLLSWASEIKAQYTPGVSYFGVNNYIEYIAGDMPIIFVAPHAGDLEPAILPDIYTRGSDNGTLELANFMADSLHFKSGGHRPHVIINHLRPSKLNPVFYDSTAAAGTHPTALQAFNDFHNFIQVAHNNVSTDWGKGHYFELHGNGTDEEWNMIGVGVSKTYLNMSDSVLMTRVNNSTVKHLCTAGGADFLGVLKGPGSLGGMLDSLGWKSTPSPAFPAPPDTVTFFYAGQNTWTYGSANSGTIDATHLESYWKFMVLAANRSPYSNDLADVILDFMNVHYGFGFNNSTALIEPINSHESRVFPNPIQSSGILTIESQNNIAKILIFNALGQLCWTQIGDNRQIALELEPGIYQVIVEITNGETELNKLIVR